MTAHPEAILQRQAAWLLDRSGLLWTHPANERKCTPAQGARLKAAGVKAGVPDVLVFARIDAEDMKGEDASFVGLAIELKVGRNTVTPEQTEWLLRLGLLGWRTAVCRSLDEVHRLLLDCYPDNAGLRSVALSAVREEEVER